MAIKPVDLSRLHSNLLLTGLQQKDNALFQVIDALIQNSRFLESLLGGLSGGGGGSSTTNITEITNHYMLASHRFSDRNNKRGRMGPPGIDGTNGTGEEGYWAPLTDGDPDETDLIFADGECIMVFIPT